MKPTERELRLSPIKNRLQHRLEAFFRWQKRKFMEGFKRTESKWQEAKPPISPSDWERIFDLISLESFGVVGYAFDNAVEEAMLAAGLMRAGAVDIAASFTLANPEAKKYLENFGFEKISQIDVVTKKNIGKIITKGIESGEGYGKTARRIKDMYIEMAAASPLRHIRNRAELIATYETGEAYEEASMLQSKGLQTAGLPMVKSWLTVGDGSVCEICDGNEQAGWIPLDDPFPSGHDRPLGHPGCRCAGQTRMAMPGEMYG